MRSQPKNVLALTAIALVWLCGILIVWSIASVTGPIRRFLYTTAVSYLLLWGFYFLMSNMPRMERAKRFLLTNSSLLLSVTLLEVLALTHLVDYRRALSLEMVPWDDPRNLIDAKLLHIHRPNLEVRWKGVLATRDVEIVYKCDQRGFRNGNDFRAADLIVIGDSFIEGHNVTTNHLITNVLGNETRLAVANLGQAWYGPQQELEVLKRFGVPLRPKTCVWAFFEGNDLSDAERYLNAIKKGERFLQDLHAFDKRSFTRNIVLKFMDRLETRSDWKDRRTSGLFVDSSGEERRIYFWPAGSVFAARDPNALEILRTCLVEAADVCRQNGIELLVMYVPTKFRVYGELCKFEEDAVCPSWKVDDLPRVVGDMVREAALDATYLDLSPVFRDAAKRGGLVYYSDDTHWSPLGHRVAAQAIAEFVRGR